MKAWCAQQISAQHSSFAFMCLCIDSAQSNLPWTLNIDWTHMTVLICSSYFETVAYPDTSYSAFKIVQLQSSCSFKKVATVTKLPTNRRQCSRRHTYIYIYIYIYTVYIWRVQMLKPLSAVWNFVLKWVFFSGSYIYVHLYHLNGNETNLFIVIKVKLLNLHIWAW